MLRSAALVIISTFFLLTSSWANTDEEWAFTYKPFSGSYEIYGGQLGDMNAPKKGDKKIAFKIDKNAAEEMFNGMGVDVKNKCSSEVGERMRQKKELICLRSSKGKYSCYFSFDLKTGKSSAGSIC